MRNFKLRRFTQFWMVMAILQSLLKMIVLHMLIGRLYCVVRSVFWEIASDNLVNSYLIKSRWPLFILTLRTLLDGHGNSKLSCSLKEDDPLRSQGQSSLDKDMERYCLDILYMSGEFNPLMFMLYKSFTLVIL